MWNTKTSNTIEMSNTSDRRITAILAITVRLWIHSQVINLEDMNNFVIEALEHRNRQFL